MDRQATYRRARVRTALAAAFFAVSGWAHAAAGDLDTTFGITGVVYVGPAVEQPNHFAAHFKQNATVSVIVSGLPGARVAQVFRTLEDGSSDATFGSGGSTLLSGTINDDATADVISDKRDRVVIGMQSLSLVSVYRLTAVGLPDATFGTAGVIQFPVTNSLGIVRVFTQRDRKILLVTTEHNVASTGAQDLAVRRFNENGSPDATFGIGGVFYWQGPGPSTRTWGAGVGLQADGRVIVSGRYATGGGPYTGYVLRLTIAGTLDPTFGTGGVTSIAWVPGNVNSARDLAVMDDDRIVTGGGSYDAAGLNGAAVLARLMADGSFDATFGSGGKSIFPLPTFGGSWFSVGVASNNKIILGGLKNESVDQTAFSGNILRFRDNGVIDTSFAGDGSFEYAPTSPPVIGGSVAFVDGNDRPVGAFAQFTGGNTIGSPILVRLEAGKKSCP
jgi:uncharacterized delta-60 repeat protein